MNDKVLKDLQKNEFSILVDFDNYCKTHNLKYYLIGGALLGAARYNGFIPWDDDIDVAMPREDYERLKNIWEQSPISKYFLQNAKTDPNFSRCIMKLRKNGTQILEKANSGIQMHHGIYIDIFPIDYVDNISEDVLGKRAQRIRRLMTLRTIKSGYKGNHNLLKNIIRAFIFWLPAAHIDKKIDTLCTKENKGEKKYSVLFLHNYSIDRQTHKSQVFGAGEVCKFENREFSAPSDTNAFLTKVFGENYMGEPPVEKQKNPHNYIDVDFENEDGIDFIVMWVDPNDENWQAKKAKYTPQKNDDVGVARYRDWDNLKYWFRSVAKFAPWVRKIHFVVDNQVPEWLDTTNEKINVVNHQDFIPKECLPLFNSSSIEIGIHKIKGLANKFVFFNDDMFITKPITPKYYFKDGLPVDIAGLTKHPENNCVFANIMLNNYSALRKHFDIKTVLKSNFFKWYNPFYDLKVLIRTIVRTPKNNKYGLIIPHLSVPYLKYDHKRVWEKEELLLRETQTHRFRQAEDMSHFVYRFWRMLEGDFKPRKSKGKYFSVDSYKAANLLAYAIKNQIYSEICINDNWDSFDIEKPKNIINDAFETIFPNKCEFEK